MQSEISTNGSIGFSLFEPGWTGDDRSKNTKKDARIQLAVNLAILKHSHDYCTGEGNLTAHLLFHGYQAATLSHWTRA